MTHSKEVRQITRIITLTTLIRKVILHQMYYLAFIRTFIIIFLYGPLFLHELACFTCPYPYFCTDSCSSCLLLYVPSILSCLVTSHVSSLIKGESLYCGSKCMLLCIIKFMAHSEVGESIAMFTSFILFGVQY